MAQSIRLAWGVALAALSIASCASKGFQNPTGGDGGDCTGAGPCVTSCGECLGGACDNGNCQPVMISDAGAGALGIAVDDESVYFANSDPAGTVMRVDKAGHGAAAPIAGGSPPSEVALSDENVYFTAAADPGAIWMAAKDGSVAPARIAPSNAVSGPTLAVAAGPDDTVFFSGAADGSSGWIVSCAAGSCGQSAYASGSFHPIDLAIDGAHLYFADPIYAGTGQAGGVARFDPGGHPAAVLASGEPSILSLAVGGAGNGTIFYGVAGQVKSTKADWGTQPARPSQVTSAGTPERMVADADYVYWVDSQSGEIWRAAAGGASSRAIARGQTGARRIAQDAIALYWTVPTGVFRLAKQSLH